MNELESKLKEYAEYLKEIEHYRTAESLMYWDMTTGMPKNVSESRAETISFMSLQQHNLLVGTKKQEFIKFFEEHIDDLDLVHKRMLDEMKKEYDFSTGERGKFYRPHAKLNLPVYLEPDVRGFVERIAKSKRSDVSTVVNKLLKTDMQLANTAK